MSEHLLVYLQNLLTYPSESPNDAGCQLYVRQVLEEQGFTCQSYANAAVDNLYAEYGGTGPLLVFAGHTDVVEAGPLNNWRTPPFELHLQDQNCYGRGVADMKGAIAAFLDAVRIVLAETQLNYRIGILLTSAEEGDDYLDGTPYVLAQLLAQSINIDACIVGEPTASMYSGDVIKIGRRGSLSATARLKGDQGHVAYPEKTVNAIHRVLPFLNALSAWHLDDGNAYFDKSQLQLTRIENFSKARNVIPGQLEFDFNIRFNTEHHTDALKAKILEMAAEFDLDLEWQWFPSAEPFMTSSTEFLNICQTSIEQLCHKPAQLSTSGGTSDARFIAPYGIPVLEIGLPNSSIHQANESVSLDNLILLRDIYVEILRRFK